VIVRLTTGIEIGFAPRDAECLQDASAGDLLWPPGLPSRARREGRQGSRPA
jgi:hypothetical protein